MTSQVLQLAMFVAGTPLLALWVATARPPSRLDAMLIALTAVLHLAMVWKAGPVWTVAGSFWPPLFAVLLALALWRLALVIPPVLITKPLRPAVFVLAFVVAALAVQNVLIWRARPADPPPLDLEWPLRGGKFVVVHGGRSSLVNHHVGIAAQRDALDIVAVNAAGLRAGGILPKQLDRYRVFGMEVFAPCGGEVVAARDGIADSGAMEEDPALAAGNYLAIACQGHTVLLAHLQSGSVALRTGDTVEAGRPIGRAGSSGNSSEPHLHIHAVTGRVTDGLQLITSASGVPMRFGGRVLMRNDVVRN